MCSFFLQGKIDAADFSDDLLEKWVPDRRGKMDAMI
jgi:hypothetical protein